MQTLRLCIELGTLLYAAPEILTIWRDIENFEAQNFIILEIFYLWSSNKKFLFYFACISRMKRDQAFKFCIQVIYYVESTQLKFEVMIMSNTRHIDIMKLNKKYLEYNDHTEVKK